jgi:hypothetical protein
LVSLALLCQQTAVPRVLRHQVSAKLGLRVCCICPKIPFFLRETSATVKLKRPVETGSAKRSREPGVLGNLQQRLNSFSAPSMLDNDLPKR